MKKALLINLALAFLLLFLFTTQQGLENGPIYIICLGVVASFFIKSDGLLSFSKRSLLFALVFCVILGIMMEMLAHSPQAKPLGTFLVFSVFTFPFYLAGLFIGAVFKGVRERVEGLKHQPREPFAIKDSPISHQ